MADPNLPPPEPGPLPSSFDGDSDFYEENRWAKLGRKLREEPLIPIGCLATCYALYQASKSIRAGDHHQTNKMFRARIYAQGFTLVALVAGSIFYKDERMQRKKFEKTVEERKAAEKREKWLEELEARDREDREWRARFEGVSQRAREVGEGSGDAARAKEEVKRLVEERFPSKSVFEGVERQGWGPGMWVLRTHNAWRRR